IEWPEHLKPGRCVVVGPGVRRLIAPNPGYMTGPGTNSYLIGDPPLAVVDPGPEDDAHLVALCEAVAGRLRWIFVTHTHLDHAPLAARLKQETGAEVVAFSGAPAIDPRLLRGPTGLDAHDASFAPDVLLGDDERIDAGDFAVGAVHTPGHTSNHLCFELS